ncbi:MAG: hypothetical protein E8D41_03340 [Nitrospira sp.]|nr:MAG: hypothetical protein E8D41_03340 [Nitrospira sp.]
MPAMARGFWVLLHLDAGLFKSFFLIVAGLTGSMLAVDGEINRWLNPFDLRKRSLAVRPSRRVMRSPWTFFGLTQMEAE